MVRSMPEVLPVSSLAAVAGIAKSVGPAKPSASEDTGSTGFIGSSSCSSALTRLGGTRDAEFALLVSDAMQGRGLGRAMLERLFDVGRDWGLERIVAEILPGNGPMRRICKSLGFTFEGETGAVKELR